MRLLSAAHDPWPANWHAAMKRSDSVEWRNAAQVEIDAHTVNGTWEPCPLPPGKKAIGSRWVFVQKFLSNGEFDRYKARLVAKGYMLSGLTLTILKPLLLLCEWPHCV